MAEIQQYLIIIKLMLYILDEIINFQYEKQWEERIKTKVTSANKSYFCLVCTMPA